MGLRVEPLKGSHRTADFDCGKRDLNRFLQTHALSNHEKNISKVFVAVDDGAGEVMGYYALAAGSVSFDKFPPDKIPPNLRYPVPVAHLGKLAIRKDQQGKGLGSLLLIDALHRVALANEHMACMAVELIAIDGDARAFYEHFGFVAFRDEPMHLFMPMDTVIKVLAR